jgi:O-antigen ligase
MYGLLLALVASLPFEPIRPLVSLGFLDLNHLKLLLGAIGVVWLVRLGGDRRLPRETWPAAVFLAVAVASALAAESFRGDALKFVGRLASGILALLVVRRVLETQPSRLTGLAWAASIGAGLSALLGLGEVANVPALQPLLSLYKVAPTRIGGDLRLSASFQYATIAAVFFELAVPLALILAATDVLRWRRIVATGIAVVCSVAVVLTLTRGGMLALAAALGVMAVLGATQPTWRRLLLPTAVAGASGAVVLGLVAVRMDSFGTRFETENDWDWYAATYAAPASLTLAQDVPTNADVTVRNTGQVNWTTEGPEHFTLAYRWLSEDAASQLEVPATMLDLPRTIAPGEAVQLTVDIVAHLPPGDYRLAWGMLQQHVLWFHDRGEPDAETLVHVTPSPDASVISPVASEPRSDTTPGLGPVPRTTLWATALQMFRQHPLLGVGPDNFRHVYGTYLGLSEWDDRVHANNLYLELLADLGALGLLAFGALVTPSIYSLIRGLRTSRTALGRVWLAGLSASLVAFYLHSTVDSFLEFTPVYLLFWLIVGMSLSAAEVDPC